MARLIVDAVSGESKFGDLVLQLKLFVSVSRADDGASVTGLTTNNFRICSPIGGGFEMKLLSGYEAQWEPTDVEPAGCYALSITYRWEKGGLPIEWHKGEFYPFGIQARVDDREGERAHTGQTVLRIESLGK